MLTVILFQLETICPGGMEAVVHHWKGSLPTNVNRNSCDFCLQSKFNQKILLSVEMGGKLYNLKFQFRLVEKVLVFKVDQS